MIGYVTLGTDNLPRAVRFFDALFASMGIPRFMEQPGHFVAWATSHDAPSVSVTRPFDGKPASVGNGVMVALARKNRAEVDATYNKALELGATSEGAPGPRMAGFYAAYFRDLDGNKFNAFCIESA
jgi:catechol 2,3-dioxygenase-like lactoylglutathione lyase family enzyme